MLLLVNFFILIVIFPRLVIFSGLFQQNHYNFSKYFKNLKRHYFKSFSTYLEYLAIICLINYYIYQKWYLIVLVLFLILGSFMATQQLLILPTITSRFKRLLISITLTGLLPYFIFPYHTVVFLLELVFIPFLIIISALINLPLERTINIYYAKKSKRKLCKIKPYVIGITGSYGKTSTKYFLSQLIKEHYYMYASPKSYNTPMGLSKCINEELPLLTEVFIAEMGATKEGDIKELIDLIEVNLGIITEIGPQHLETFKTIEKVLEAKLEILNSKQIETLIVNFDNEYLRKYQYPSNLEIITIGTTEQALYYGKNIILTKLGLEFDIYFQNNYWGHICTKLLGKHNVTNILCAVAASEHLRVPKQHIIKRIQTLEAFPHRLSLQTNNNILLIDDSFNSNIVGFKNALEVLRLTEGKKLVITPGIVDAGERLENLNMEIARCLVKDIDMVYLVHNASSLYIEQYFNQCGFNNYKVVKSFKVAYEDVKKNYKEEVAVLIENDLPDNYLRR